MKIDVWHIGKKSKNLYQDAEKEFTNRIKRYCQFSNSSIQALKQTKSLSPQELLKKEAKLFESKISANSFTVLLDEKGKQYNSREFANEIEKIRMSHPHITFLIGGAYGFDEELKSRSGALMSLSKMTLPHHLARVVFLEQLYRAFSIINNEPYHND